MSGKATGWAIKSFPILKAADRNAKLVLVAVADSANQYGQHARVAIEVVCEEWGFDRSTVRRHLQRLVEDGWLEIEEPSRGRGGPTTYRLPRMMAEPITVQNAPQSERQNAPQSGDITGHSETEMRPNSPPDTFFPYNGSNGKDTRDEPSPARLIVQRVWERRNPKPATPFVAVVKIATKLLAAGHSPAAVEDAMVAVPTISTGWVEAELNKRARPAQSTDSKLDMIAGKLAEWRNT